jgi:hypothetical protein
MIVTQQTAPAQPSDPAVEEDLDRLAVMPIAQLRVRYREVFRTDPPKAFGPDLLRRSIAQRVQEDAYGGLSRCVQRLLDQLVKAYIAQPGGKIVLSRRIKPGSVLLREWNGQSHRVMVLADGFAYDGKTFGNLSEIAGLITGTRWNGPRFFGLRSKAQDPSEPSGVPDPSAGGNRKPDAALPRSEHLGGGSDYRKRNAARASQSLRGNRHGL